MPNIIYADIESFITKVEECANNPKKTSILKIGLRIFNNMGI